MGLRLYNTLTGQKEEFVPFDRENVRMYVCGPTVYDFAHIGNARPVIVFDVLFRLLRHLYGEDHVTYVRNITDVDDKIILRAAEEYPELPLNEAIREVTGKTERQFHDDVAALGCLPPTVEPRATEHIAEMRAMIEALVAKGCAYVAEEHVLFSVASMPEYGRLSHRSLDDMIAGARVEVAPYKRDPMDFVLWKPSKPGEPAWPSPAGIATPGRPGWHIECSAMSDKWLWDEALPRLSDNARKNPHQFDIHGGGIDLVFPHHENEIAQSRCANSTPLMARYWMHNGFLQVEGEKMSKSLGNFVTIRQLLTGWRGVAWPGQVVRFAMLQTHYRQPMDFTEEALDEASMTLRMFSFFASRFADGGPSSEFNEALDDDLNTPRAIAELHRLARAAKAGDISAKHKLAKGLQLLGLPPEEYNPEWLQEQARQLRSSSESNEIDTRIAARAAARKAKDFAEADRIRDELDRMGIQLKDAKDPKTGELVTTWEVKR